MKNISWLHDWTLKKTNSKYFVDCTHDKLTIYNLELLCSLSTITLFLSRSSCINMLSYWWTYETTM